MNKLKTLIIMVLLVSALSGCSTSKPLICTTVYPVEYLVKRIGGDFVNVCSLSDGPVIQRATIKSNYQQLIDQATVVMTMGQLEPYLQIYLADLRRSRVDIVDLASTSVIYEFKRYTTAYVAGSEVTLESKYYEGMEFDRVDIYGKDPILWIDPIATTSMAKHIRDWLVENYPEEKKLFEDNYVVLASELARLDAEFQSLKTRKLSMKFVSITPSFGNWQKAYGVSVYPVILSRYGVIPSDEQMQIIKQRIIDDGVQYIAFEPNLNEELRGLYNQLRSELNLTQINLHNLHTLTQNDIDGNKDYLTIMFENLSLLESIGQ
ncbi:MAG: zinc ABC transporter substrate-binding protein [Erysipelotrichaceae bacterium]|nr:zinc ABC transporter substrate-binding protein [Erysipelotrichaceae bacterium]MDP3305451.1 zinc ABC transporter substrate-binding protein [Erysipelotrichaceae bacterium]